MSFHISHLWGQLKLSTQYISHPLLLLLFPSVHPDIPSSLSLALPGSLRLGRWLSFSPQSAVSIQTSVTYWPVVLKWSVYVGLPARLVAPQGQGACFLPLCSLYSCLVCKRISTDKCSLNQLIDSLWPNSRDWEEGLFLSVLVLQES